MSHDELIIAVNTVWVVVAGALVLFMQAGFALLEAGLTRMKNAAHIAGKNVLVFAVCAVVFWAVGFGIAFGDAANGAGGWLSAIIGTSGFAPGSAALLAIGAEPFSFFGRIPAAAAWFFQVAFAGVSLAIVWGAMAERAKLWVYIAFGAVFTVIYSVAAHWIWHADGWLFGLGMQDFAGSTVVHYQGALGALAGALLLGPRIGKFGRDGRANPIPGHNMPFAVIGTLILWLGWIGFNPGSTLGVEAGGTGFFAYVALVTNLGAAAGLLGGLVTAWLMIGKPDMSMMLNGVIAALVAITAACGFVSPAAAVFIGFVAGAVAIATIPLVERLGVDDPIGAISVHGLAGVWGTVATGLFATPALAERVGVGQAGLLYGGGAHQVGVQLLGLAAVGVFSFGLSFAALWAMKRLWGIRVEEHVEIAGLDVSEHGMWGYPEFYIPVPGGYGTDAHGHLGPHAHASSVERVGETPATAPARLVPSPVPAD